MNIQVKAIENLSKDHTVTLVMNIQVKAIENLSKDHTVTLVMNIQVKAIENLSKDHTATLVMNMDQEFHVAIIENKIKFIIKVKTLQFMVVLGLF